MKPFLRLRKAEADSADIAAEAKADSNGEPTAEPISKESKTECGITQRVKGRGGDYGWGREDYGEEAIMGGEGRIIGKRRLLVGKG